MTTDEESESEFELGVELTRVPTADEANVIAALLHSCGIEANVAEQLRSQAPSQGSAVYVHARDLDLAREILDAPPVDDQFFDGDPE